MADAHRHIEVIAEKLNAQRCVFLLGPELACGEQGKPLQEELLLQLAGKKDLEFEPDLDFMVRFKKSTARQYFYTDLKKYYLQHGACEDIHQKLARLPGHVYLSFTPDLKLRNGFLDSGIAHTFAYYNKKQNPQSSTRSPVQSYP